MTNTDYEELLRKSLARIESLEAQLARKTKNDREPIAIVGMSCRFAGARDADEFWELLRASRDALQEVPRDRWDVDAYYDAERGKPGKMYTRKGYFIDGIAEFDPSLFSISGREAAYMDPQQRLLLEGAWEAIESAGVSLATLSSEKTGTFVAAMSYDYSQIVAGVDSPDLHAASGTSPSALSGRISYTLGLRGPSVTLDTACSSSLVALHLACLSLRSRETNWGLVGGVNLQLTAYGTVMECASQMLAVDGRCKTFDEGADGFGRGDGCAVLLLKRLADAVRDGDHVLAVVRGTAVNHDGEGGGLSVPNGKAHEDLMRTAFTAAGVHPDDVDFVEAHGTGTKLGDPIEIQAIESVFKTKQRGGPLYVGAVKTNVGHTEGAAGLAGLVKTVLMCERDELVPNRNLRAPSSKIPWNAMRIEFPAPGQRWPRSEKRALACVNSFGLCGTNASVVVEQHRSAHREEAAEDPVHALCLSAQSGKALVELVERHADRLSRGPVALGDYCFTTNTSRAQMKHRAAFVARSQVELLGALSAARGRERPPPPAMPRVVFLFTGEGRGAPGADDLGPWLAGRSAAFDDALYRVAPLYRNLCGKRLEDVLFGSERRLLEERVYGVPALFAHQYAVARALQALGVEPDAVLGTGVGQCSAAAVAGIFDVEVGLRLAANLGCIGPETSRSEAVALLEKNLTGVELCEPDIPLIAPASGAYVGPDACRRGYWASQLLRSEQASQALQALQMGVRPLVIEVGDRAPNHEPLVASAARKNADVVAVLDRGGGDRARWPSMLAALFERGLPIRWDAYYGKRPHRRLPVPTYPFQRRSYWVPAGDRSRWSFADPLARGRHRGRRLERVSLPEGGERRYELTLRAAEDPFVAEHRLGGQCVLAGSSVMALLFDVFSHEHPGRPLRLHDLVLLKPVTLAADDDLVLHVRVAPKQERFETKVFARIASRESWEEICSAAAEILPADARERAEHDVEAIAASWTRTVPADQLYAGIAAMGYHLGRSYQWLGDGWYQGADVVRSLRKPDGVLPALTAVHPGFLDSAMQSVESSGVESSMNTKEGHVYVPLMARSLTLYGRPDAAAQLWVRARGLRAERPEAMSREADVVVFDESRQIVARWDRLEYRQVDLSKLAAPRAPSNPYYEIRWEAFAPPERSTPPFDTIAVYTRGDVEAAREQLRSIAREIIVVKLADRFRKRGRLTYDSGGLREMDALNAAISEDSPAVQAVVYDAREGRDDDYQSAVLDNFYYPLSLIAAVGRWESTVKELFVVTADAQKAVAHDTLSRPFGAMQWALARTARNEYPTLALYAIDTVRGASLDVVGAVRSLEGQPLEVAVREAGLYRPVLAAATLARSPARVDSAARYLVTGGTRGVGLLACQWLRARGARRFILAARTVDDVVKGSVRAALGADVELEFVALDLTSPEAIQRELGPILKRAKDVKGIVHAAGQQNAQLIAAFDAERARRDLDTKALGLLQVLELVEPSCLDFTICTSSIAALFGPPGTAAYSAANAFLDSYAQSLSPAYRGFRSVNFGAWSGIGIFAGMSAEQREQLEGAGVIGITGEQGTAIFDAVFEATVPSFAAANFDWPKLLARTPARGAHDWLAAFRHLGADAEPRAADGDARGSLDAWRALPAAEKEPWLRSFYTRFVARICQLDEATISPSESMSRFGLDSVMAIEIRQRVQDFCGLELSMPEILDNASIDGLVEITMDFVLGSDPSFFSRKKWDRSSGDERAAWLRAFYRDAVARICQLDEGMIADDEAMSRYGLDSVMAIEIRQRVQSFCGFELSMPDILDDATVGGLVEKTRRFLEAAEIPGRAYEEETS